MDDVIPVRQRLPKRNLKVFSARLEREVLISERGSSPVLSNGDDNKRQIEIVLGTVGQLHHPIHAVAAHHRRPQPFEYQACRYYRLKFLVDSVSRMGGVFNGDGIGESSTFGGTAYQNPLGCKRNSFRQIT